MQHPSLHPKYVTFLQILYASKNGSRHIRSQKIIVNYTYHTTRFSCRPMHIAMWNSLWVFNITNACLDNILTVLNTGLMFSCKRHYISSLNISFSFAQTSPSGIHNIVKNLAEDVFQMTKQGFYSICTHFTVMLHLPLTYIIYLINRHIAM